MDNEELLFMNANLPEQPANLARNSDCIMWEKSTDQQHSIFDSALSSLVSSPEKSSDSFVIIGKLGYGAPMTELSGDPGFSCFGSRSFNGRTDNRGLPAIRNSGKLTRVSSTPALKALVLRKSKELPISPSPSFSKAQEKEGKKKREEEEEESTKAHDEPPKDYIHVRARRGQATDSHSLAERVRREKIGERMKLLQDLVPGCNKVTGKALMLDEIINYVQSLQRQVEFLSMKLSSANDTRLDFNVETLVSKDITIPSSSNRLHEETLQSVSSNHHHHQLNNYNYNNSQLHANISSSNMMLQSPINSMETSTLAGSLTHLPTLTQFTDSISQV